MTIRGVNIQRIEPLRAVDTNWGTWSYNRNLIGQDKLPFLQRDWPNPVPPFRIEQTWTSNYNWKLLGKDTIYGAQGQTQPFDWPNPTPVIWYRDWSLNLLQTTLKPAATTPKSWVDIPPIQWYQGWYQSQTSSYPLYLIGKDQLPIRQQDWPTPTPVQWYQHWSLGLNLTTLFVVTTPKRPIDWPVPQPVQWYRDWSLNPSLSLNTLVILPFNQYSWPNPIPQPLWDFGQESFVVQSSTAVPFIPIDWQNPIINQYYRGWEQNLLQTTLFTTSPTPPRGNKDWPNPIQPFRLEQTWTAYYNYNLIGLDQLPTRQQDWPVPLDPRAYRSWEYSYNRNLIGQDKLPALLKDFPNPYPVQWNQFWSQSLVQNFPIANTPRNQWDWPVPQPVTWYQDYRENLLQTTLFTTPATPPIRNYDWRLPFPVTWDQFWASSPFVPPVPVVVIGTGGRQVGWDEIERVERFSQAFLKDHNAPVPPFYNTNPNDPSIKARDAAVRLGRLGGIASGKARKK